MFHVNLKKYFPVKNSGSALMYISSKLEYERNSLFWGKAGAEMQVYLVLVLFSLCK